MKHYASQVSRGVRVKVEVAVGSLKFRAQQLPSFGSISSITLVSHFFLDRRRAAKTVDQSSFKTSVLRCCIISCA